MSTALTKDRIDGRMTVVTYAALGGDAAENGESFTTEDMGLGIVMTVTGNFGGGADVALEGSNDGTNFFAITRDIGDGLGLTAVVFSAAGMARVDGPFPLYMRAAGNDQGDANTNLAVIIVGTNLR